MTYHTDIIRAGDDQDEVVRYTKKMEAMYDAARTMKTSQARKDMMLAAGIRDS